MEKNLIKLNKVSKFFKVGEENFTALHEVSLEIESGAFMSFVGPSGSGKTTLLNLIGGLDVPTSGDIYFKESGLSSMSRQQMAQYRSCLLYTSPSPRDGLLSRMPSSA